MGWPLAVSAGLMEKSSRALVAALWPLTVGHLLAMLLVLLPFALLVTLVECSARYRSVPASLSSGSASSGSSTGAIHGPWRGYDRRNWGFGPSPWRSRTARD